MKRTKGCLSLGASTWIALACAAGATAQQVPIDPASTHIFPAGGQRGTVVQVRVGCQCLPPGTALAMWGAGVKAPSVLGPQAAGRYEPSPRRDPRETPMAHPKEWHSTVEIAADALLGQTLWRLSSGRGGTGARAFVVGALPEFVETESNSSPQTAQRVSLPVTINGQIAGERDTDYFEFSAEAGETITAEVVAARLGSPLETVIEIHDSVGHRVPAQELRAGSDPVLVCKAPASGDYRLFVANLSFRGGAEFIYRVTLSKLPYVQLAFPPVAQRGQPRELMMLLAMGDGPLVKQTETLLAPAESGEHWLAAPRPAANPIAIEVTDATCVIEQEPNDARAQATPLEAGVVAAGQLATATDEDWFSFEARKDQMFSIDCKASPKNSPALPVVSLQDAAGATLAISKSADMPDRVCRLDWRAPADGKFYLRVADVEQGAAGGPEFVYALALTQGRPDFSLTAKSDFVSVTQGERAEFELSVTRRGGFEGLIELAIEGLPEGVKVEPRQIPPGQPTIKLGFLADAGARPTAAPLTVVGTAGIDGTRRSRTLLTTHLGHDADGVGVGRSTIDNVQLTVAHKPVFKLYCSEAYQYAYRGTVYPYAMQIERLDGFEGPIHLEVADRQIKDLDGIQIPEMTVEPGQTSFMLRLFLPETMHINIQAHSNVYAQGYVSFVDKWGQQQSHLVVSTMRCMVRTLPPVAKLQAVDRSVAARPGGSASCRLELIRTSNFSGPVKIELVPGERSAGCSAEPVTLAAGELAASIQVRVDAGAKPRPDAALVFRAIGGLPGDVQVISEAHVGLDLQ